ncbi:Outer membrane protein OmpA [Muriicola jejuensis]|uniref:OmpA family protein n=1 Tax=Muriicola jejuensis TaxID=504488 RepID=A0A6P0UEA4_9FLAO|nr:OmpA family protein [Muriicola jejuensis]NER11555.1 OmpA family protein [Muriicola jejuensis]SMP19717.1 Outer membrane protein OmpA [Muriicola jejuensis]
MKKYFAFPTFILLVGSFSLYAQEIPALTSKDSIIQSSWMVGVGWNFIDDSGDAFNDFTTIRDQWNGVAFPSRINVGRYWKSGLGLELIGTYNNYKAGNTIDGITIPEDIPYWGIDTRLSYDLNKLVGETGFFDPYVGVGLGYSDANNLGRGTYNAIIGFRTWFSERWGLDFSSSGKWSFGNEASNHIQHAVAVIYQFNIKKELSKKGEEKLAMLEEMEKEQQRIQDSLLAARLAKEEARLLAERLEEEREAARLAALEKAKNDRINNLRQALDSLGAVYFAFDSSYLNESSKETLDAVSELMNAYPEISFEIHAYTDSRGPADYNQWLSERRAGRTLEYLISKGIGEHRMKGIGHGESLLSNGCSDGVRCTREEHQQNRRSEVTVIRIAEVLAK